MPTIGRSAALRARGLEVAIVAWDDPAFDWSSVRLVFLGNPWDYFHRRDEFLAWAERVERVTRLENPLAVLRWNLHKGYLVELARAGAPVVPTALLPRGPAADLVELARRRGWGDVVAKPAVSADSWETHVVAAADLAAGQAHVDRLQPARDLLVQQAGFSGGASAVRIKPMRPSPTGAARRLSWASELNVEGGAGQVVANGQSAVFAGRGRSTAVANGRRGENRVEAQLVQGSGRPGTWKFELGGTSSFEPGSLRLIAGDVALITADSITFRLKGTPGERVVFSFKTQR